MIDNGTIKYNVIHSTKYYARYVTNTKTKKIAIVIHHNVQIIHKNISTLNSYRQACCCNYFDSGISRFHNSL